MPAALESLRAWAHNWLSVVGSAGEATRRGAWDVDSKTQPGALFFFGVALLALAASAYPAAAVEPRIALATSDDIRGALDVMDTVPPWSVQPAVELIGRLARLRYFLDRLYVINPSQDSIQVVDPVTLETILVLPLARGASPEDICVTEPDRAFVTQYNSAWLAVIDPSTGAWRGAIDLSGFSDADGLPEMSMMARDGRRLFVQIQRLDRTNSNRPVPPSYLAVVDLITETLIDADPGAPGIQGIQLLGTAPVASMHVDRRARRLFVSAPGPRLNTSGGIEEIDLESLMSLGFILSEASIGADLGGFVMTSVDAGYALAHTEVVASSHLHSFSRGGGQGPQIAATFGHDDSLALDPVTGYLFFPDPFSARFGVLVIDTATNTLLTGVPVPTGMRPWDLTVMRTTTPGEVGDLRVQAYDPDGGGMTLSYEPACGASNHNIVFGPLAGVSAYAYAGQVCGIGSSGTYGGFDPGPGSSFFLVVAAGAAGNEGSYGVATGGIERPEVTGDPDCDFVQDLSFACDR